MMPATLAASALSRVFADPAGERWLVDVARGEGKHDEDRCRIVGYELIAVDVEKKLDRNISSTLVAVDEGMVTRNSEAVRRCKIGDVRRSIGAQIPGPGERGLEQAGIARAGSATMLGKLRFVNCNDHVGRKPSDAGHLASSRNTARRFFMIARAAFICDSNSSLCGVMR